MFPLWYVGKQKSHRIVLRDLNCCFELICACRPRGHEGYELEGLIGAIKSARRSDDESESSGRHRHNENETEFWGYVDVRPGAHMFYWLYQSSHADGYLSRPLVIWLQV